MKKLGFKLGLFLACFVVVFSISNKVFAALGCATIWAENQNQLADRIWVSKDKKSWLDGTDTQTKTDTEVNLLLIMARQLAKNELDPGDAQMMINMVRRPHPYFSTMSEIMLILSQNQNSLALTQNEYTNLLKLLSDVE